MKRDNIYKILTELKKNKISVDKAFKKLKDLPFKDLGFAKIDYHRELRMGMPEAILCKGKTTRQVIDIFKEMNGKTNVIATKASNEVMERISKEFPEAEIYKEAGIIFSGKYPRPKKGKVMVLTAGTSDIPVATEAIIVLKAMGVEVESLFDVGAAGIHRLIKFKETIENADIIIIAAGMDGMLPGVVAGLFGLPIIAIPTSIGYGANFSGLSPLLTMLNSCAPGVVVVNIDNGYGAGYFAGLIALMSKK